MSESAARIFTVWRVDRKSTQTGSTRRARELAGAGNVVRSRSAQSAGWYLFVELLPVLENGSVNLEVRQFDALVVGKSSIVQGHELRYKIAHYLAVLPDGLDRISRQVE